MVEKHLKNQNILKCYTTKLGHEIEKSNHPKLAVHDLENLWDKKTKTEKNKIANIFNVTPKTLALLETKSVILITQLLSEDNIISEEEKIALYKSILNNYGLNSVVIKPHPREKQIGVQFFQTRLLFLNKCLQNCYQ